MTAVRRAADGLVFAVTFLTVLPLRLRGGHDGAAAAPAWFPLVGAAVGLAGGGVFAAAHGPLGASVAAVLALATLVALTGALHQDGLADCADGLGVRGDRDRRLAVMRDPANGTFGTLALVVWALLFTTTLERLGTAEAVGALALAGATGRLAALLHARWTPSARADGLGAAFSPTGAAGLVAALTTACLTVAAGVASLGATAALAPALGAITTFALGGWTRRTLGGRTGDTLGATVVLAELVSLIGILASLDA